jgi:hypothetical protein
MNRVAFCTFAAAALLGGAAAAQAQPLAFGAVNGEDDYSERADLAQCRPAADDGARQCVLKRSSFGGLPVSSATMTLNPDGKARSLDIVLDAENFDLAYQLLVGRYGPPTAARGFPLWTGFDDGASLTLRRAGARATVSFDFPANAAASSATPGALPFLLLAGLGLLAGGLAYRAYGAKRAPVPNISMRATLERRLREGRDLQF